MPRDPDDFARGDRLDRSFFEGQARHVAPALLGTLLLDRSGDRPVGGLVVETEAYTDGREQ